MRHRISNFLTSRKGRDIALIALIILTATASFGLGRLSAVKGGHQGASVQQVAATAQGKNDDTETSSDVEAHGALAATDESVVASKSGEVYHLPWCSGASRMKEENKVWYDSPEAAKAAGLRPAANCKGLE